MTKTKKLLFYIGFQIFAIILLVVTYLSIQSKENAPQYDPVNIILAKQQIDKAKEIRKTIEHLSSLPAELRNQEVLELILKISDWKEAQGNIQQEIELGNYKPKTKEFLRTHLKHASNYLNHIDLSTRLIIQKSASHTVVNSFLDVVNQNESGYINEMQDVTNHLRDIDTKARHAADLKEQIVFFLALALVLINIIILVSPLKKHILD